MFKWNIKKYRLLAQLVFWGFYILIIFLVGVNFTSVSRLSIFLAFSLVFSAIVVYTNYWVLLPVL
ncbi:MAG: hypothetical protein D6714_15595, partial [Bacteroidetes bacterium]